MQSVNEISKKAALHTLGCRLNFSESGSIAEGFAKRGYELVEFGQPCDVVFLNTCTVTDGADSSCRNLIRKAQKSAPEAKIVVAGCYAQMEAEKIKKMSGVDLILGSSEKYKVFDYLDEDEANIVKIDKTNEFFAAATTAADKEHTRAFLKIQDGCNYVCSFCIIPFARGRSRTITISEAKKMTQTLVQSGHQEVVLTGVNIGEYESTSGEKLIDLIKEVASVDGLKRLRLSSVEPNTISEQLLKTLKDIGIYQDHFHVPMQSASDSVLASMRRKYDYKFYLNTLTMIKDYFPKAGIGADIITGYPGEVDEDFELTYYRLKEELPITHFHVFPYSKRKGTTASRLADHIQADEKKRRVRELIKLGEQKLTQFAASHVGGINQVLFETYKDGHMTGLSETFLKCRIKTDLDLSNQIHHVKIINSNQAQLVGQLV